MTLVSRMLSAVEGQAFGELADLACANAAEKRAFAWSRTFSGKQVRGNILTFFLNEPGLHGPNQVLKLEH